MTSCPFCGGSMQPTWNKIDYGSKYSCPNRCASKIREKIEELEQRVAAIEAEGAIDDASGKSR